MNSELWSYLSQVIRELTAKAQSAALIVVLRLSQGYSWEKGDRMLLAREGGRAGS